MQINIFEEKGFIKFSNKKHYLARHITKIFQMFISKKDVLVKYRKQFEVLNKKVKRANNALISDSLLFSRGMHVASTPVRAFVYEERMREAVFGAP